MSVHVLNPLKRNLELEIINSGKNVLFDVPQTDVSVDKIVLEPLSIAFNSKRS